MEADDPFASIVGLCQVSSSQEELLRHCRFVGEPEVEEQETDTQVSGEIDEQLTDIMIVTAPETPQSNAENENNSPKGNENVRTPLENSQIASSTDRRDDRTVVIEKETKGGCTESEKTVDLGADRDFVISEVELTQRSGSVNEVIQSELNKVRGLKREIAAREHLIECLKKKSKISDNNLCSESSKGCLGESVKKIMKSAEKLNFNIDSPYICGDKSPQSNQNHEAIGESSVKRKLEFLTENLGFESKASDRGLGFGEELEHGIRKSEGVRPVCNNGNGDGTSNLHRKSIQDIDKYRYTGSNVRNSSEMGRGTQAIRALPASICGKADNGARNDHRKFTVWDVLRMLAKKCDCDLHNLENKSLLDVAKSRGMTFP